MGLFVSGGLLFAIAFLRGDDQQPGGFGVKERSRLAVAAVIRFSVIGPAAGTAFDISFESPS